MIYKNKYYVKKWQKDINSLIIADQYYPKKQLVTNIDNYKDIENKGLHYSFLGHSSIYLKFDDISILIDPILSKRVGLFSLFGISRFKGKCISNKDLPHINLVLITHNHYDHLDLHSIKSLDKQTDYFVVPKGNKKLLTLFGINPNKIIELVWQQTFNYKNIQIVCTPAHHTSTRYLFDLNKSLWCSYVIKNNKYKVFHSGDTAFSKHFMDISKEYNNFDLVFIECGQYGATWHNMHMFPEESVDACKILNAKLSIPIHWGAFRLSNHAWFEPLLRFKNYAIKNGINFVIPSIYKIY